MLDHSTEIMIPSIKAIKHLLEPILVRLDAIEDSLKNQIKKGAPQKFYRNADLRNLFGLSPNTIIKYRETGVLPYTRLGDIYLYEVKVINQILENNKISL